MGSQYPASYKTDEALQGILFETATWAINGRSGQVLCLAPSLRRALDRAAGFAASGAIVVALCRLPGDSIVVFEAQAERLRKYCAGQEVSPIRESNYWRAADSVH